MNKIKILAILTSLFFFQSVNAYEFTPLNQVPTEGDVSMLYHFERCSSAFSYIWAQLGKEGSAKAKETAQLYLERYLYLTKLTWLLREKTYNISSEKAQKDSSAQTRKYIDTYFKDGKEAFARNGGYFSGIIKSDMEWCEGLYKELQK